MVKFVNLTPHEVVVYDQEGREIVLRIPPSGKVARVTSTTRVVGEVNGIPVRRVEYGSIVDLPEPQENTIYIVSTLVLLALKEKGVARNDIVSPDTNTDSVIRDSQGRVIGVKYFQTL